MSTNNLNVLIFEKINKYFSNSAVETFLTCYKSGSPSLDELISEEINKNFSKSESELLLKCYQSSVAIDSLSTAELDCFELLEKNEYLAKEQRVINEELVARFGAEPNHQSFTAIAMCFWALIERLKAIADYVADEERYAKEQADIAFLRQANGSEAWEIARQNELMRFDKLNHFDKLIVHELSATIDSMQAEWLVRLYKGGRGFPDYLLLSDEISAMDKLVEQGYVVKGGDEYRISNKQNIIQIINQARNNAEKQLLVDAIAQGEGSEVWKEARQLSLEKLNTAARAGNLTAFNLLFKRFLNADNPDETGKTAFHHAAEHGKVEIMSALLMRNANINAADNDGNTPLLVAAKSVLTSIVTIAFLLENGANFHATNDEGEDAIAVARKRKNWAILDAIEDYQRSEKEKDHLDGLIKIPVEQADDELAFGF